MDDTGDRKWPYSGLLLGVYVPSAIPEEGKELGGHLTRYRAQLTLIGIADYRRQPNEPEPELDYTTDPEPRKPRVNLLDSEYWQAASSELAPAVWLVMGKGDEGERYLIPTDPATLQPNFEYTKPGGHFAFSNHPVYGALFGMLVDSPFRGAVPVYDLPKPAPPSKRDPVEEESE